MATSSQVRAVGNRRERLKQRGIARFEVQGLATDRELIRSLARRLTEDSPEAAKIRGAMQRSISIPLKKGGILDALRRSPLVGADLNLVRPLVDGRRVEL
jgi:hypothetical protein